MQPAGPTSDTTDHSEKPIGRRTFLGLIVAGLAALLLGKEVVSGFRTTLGSSGSDGYFRIRSIAPGPQFDPDSWELVLDGLVRRPRTLTYSQFLDLPQVEFTRDFYCVEGWGVSNVRWRGTSIRELMAQADIDPLATHLVFHSGDGVYTDSLTLEEALRPDSMLAYEANEETLPYDNGRPVRLVLPGSYAYKDVKWVVRVEAIVADDPGPNGYLGYWERRGYPADATTR